MECDIHFATEQKILKMGRGVGGGGVRGREGASPGHDFHHCRHSDDEVDHYAIVIHYSTMMTSLNITPLLSIIPE